MSKFLNCLRLGLVILGFMPALAVQAKDTDIYAGIGRAATPQEIEAWNIDVRPDFLGLPKGSGSVEQGQVLWENKCEACHGIFGEANSTFTPITGGITPKDIKTGRVAGLLTLPERSALMKVATVSTLWDFIRRAMPWGNAQSLTPDETYALVAYLLNVDGIIPADFMLDQDSIKEVQKLMPNRNGMTTEHAMWPGSKTKPDAPTTACMKNCALDEKLTSSLPDYALGAHGNLADQMRPYTAIIGLTTH